jgi:hypothetical protein
MAALCPRENDHHVGNTHTQTPGEPEEIHFQHRPVGNKADVSTLEIHFETLGNKKLRSKGRYTGKGGINTKSKHDRRDKTDTGDKHQFTTICKKSDI